MTSGMTAFMVAVGGTSLICYLLMNRAQNRKARRRVLAATPPAQARATVPERLEPASWFGSDSSSSHNSSSSSDSGSGGGGRSDGGGDGGGGGGD